MRPKGLEFTSEQIGTIEKIVQELYISTGAESILLADVTGQLISVAGHAEINTAAISAVAAGSFAATKEMARLIGEPARFKLVLQEGDTRSVYLSDVGEELVLITIFGSNTTIGLVRISTRKAVVKLLDIVASAQNNPANTASLYPETLPDALSDTLDNFFKTS